MRAEDLLDRIAEALSKEREATLAAIYARGGSSTQLVIAKYCDEVLDGSGALLGRVRDKARISVAANE